MFPGTNSVGLFLSLKCQGKLVFFFKWFLIIKWKIVKRVIIINKPVVLCVDYRKKTNVDKA